LNENILDTITGEEPWIEEALKRLELEGNVYEVSSRRVAILEMLGLIARTDNFGLSYETTIVGRAFFNCSYEHRVKYVIETRNQLNKFVGFKGYEVAPKEV